MNVMDYKVWVKYSEDDLWAAKVAFENNRFSISSTHSHDAAEKILKAVMLKNGMDIERIHLLYKMCNTLATEMPVLQKYTNEIDDMDYLYMPSRYPANIVIDKGIAERHLKTANVIFDEAIKTLK